MGGGRKLTFYARANNNARGGKFCRHRKGLYQSKDGETPNKKISSVALAITKIERRWSGKKIKELLHIKVSCTDDKGTVTKTIKVSSNDFKKIFETIRWELPATYTSLDDFDAKEEYLTKIYQSEAERAEVEFNSDLGGWGSLKEFHRNFMSAMTNFTQEWKFYSC